MAQDNTLEGAAMTMETLQLIDDYETLKGKYDELKVLVLPCYRDTVLP